MQRGQQRHVQRRLAPTTQLLELPAQIFGQLDGLGGALVGSRASARPVRRQLQHRRARQLPPPVLELCVDDLRLRRLPLPPRVICVLDRQLRQRGRAPGCKRLVEGAELARQDPHRPAIRRDVMRGEHENVLVIRQPQEEGAQHQVCAQIERPSDGLPQNLLRLAVPR